MRRVVVTGMDAISSLGRDKQEMWQRMVQGEEGIFPIKDFDVSAFPIKVTAPVNYGRIEWQADEEWLKYMTEASYLFNVAAMSALQESFLLESQIDRKRIGVIAALYGNKFLTPSQLEKSYLLYAKNNRYSDIRDSDVFAASYYARRSLYSTGLIFSSIHNILGPVKTTDTACSSGSDTVGEAYRLIKNDDTLDAVIAGGTSSLTDLIGVSAYSLIDALTTYEERASRPFDKTRGGFVIGEGSGVVVVESLESALQRSAPIYAEIIGYGSSLNAYRVTDASPEGYMKAMRDALTEAGIDKDNIDYISAHGTSTPQNDLSETTAIKAVFGDRAYKIPVSSIKSMIGHTVCASGVIELIATIRMMKESVLLPTINYKEKDPQCDLDYVPNKKRENYNITTALSNSSGLGGSNSTLIVKKMEIKHE
ncbi:MAG: beta-ketoacyl-[acyl-carrier-protein] synthase family protein [Candidatus Aminicenantes bacterium]|nr:MAG: beta-ketoacyl-[acyl-carrier-protein] synthase family protein [Candidatus Aminicenantes bacterium]